MLVSCCLSFQIPVLNIQMKMVPAICTFLGAIFSCTNYFRVIFTGGVGKNGSTIAVSVAVSDSGCLEQWCSFVPSLKGCFDGLKIQRGASCSGLPALECYPSLLRVVHSLCVHSRVDGGRASDLSCSVLFLVLLRLLLLAFLF